MLDFNISNSEIKNLLLLLLLKSGTNADEIQTALQMARVSQFMAEPTEQQDAPPSRPYTAKVASMTPKQVVRNSHLAPIKNYYSA